MEVKSSDQESLGEGTDFFSTLPMGLSEEESYIMKIHPTSSSQNEAPLIYEFDVDDGHYADLSQSFHYVNFRIMKSDRTTPITPTGAGNALTNLEKVAPINYPGNTIFSNVELYLNNEMIESSNNLYPYKAYIQAFLSNPSDVKTHQMAVSGYYEDTGTVHAAAVVQAMDANDCANKGLRQRFDRSRLSTPFATISPLHLDFCGQSKYILNRTEVKIRMTRSRTEFALISGDDDGEYSIVLADSYLMVRMVKPRESLRLAIEESLNDNPARYPMKQCEMRFYTNAGTSQTIVEPNMYTGHLPTRVAIGLVATEHLDGDLTKSPFYFDHFNVTEIDLKVNGKSVTTDPLKISIDNSDHTLPFAMLYQNTGGLFQNESLISYEQYKYGFFLYVFDLTQDNDHDADHFHQPRTGVISLDIRTSAAPGTPVSIVSMFEKEVVLTCDKDRTYSLLS